MNINTPILRDLNKTGYESFEIIISLDEKRTDNLWYFWNRYMYKCHNLLYLTFEQLTSLCQDQYFAEIIASLSPSETKIEVVSLSLSTDNINTALTMLGNIVKGRRFVAKDVSDFPFKVVDSKGANPWQSGEAQTIQTIVSDKGLFSIPLPSFANEIGFYNQK